jgi:hypothetical protein
VSVEELRLNEDGETLVTESERDFENKIRINGFAIDPRSFTVDLLWEARSTMDADYTAFLHVINSDGELVGQADVFPTLPSHYWRYGELYFTSHHLQFFNGEADLEPGQYTLLTGWYLNDGETYPRLTIVPTIDEEVERTVFELMTFEKIDNRIYRWPNYEESEDASPLDDLDEEVTPETTGFDIIDLDEPEETEAFIEDLLDSTDEPDADTTDEIEATVTDAADDETDVTATPDNAEEVEATEASTEEADE